MAKRQDLDSMGRRRKRGPDGKYAERDRAADTEIEADYQRSLARDASKAAETLNRLLSPACPIRFK